ncbi:hypothetical protein E2C01_020061 [Portunus trituberculatus]|uniref:Uncharacterized protein n=1 Tax=Portunus trituberculatus TaxID=210409 RepID=A0A5B7DZ03_PORTR|nr:hypothetical protein [Portunus trituberculatus]
MPVPRPLPVHMTVPMHRDAGERHNTLEEASMERLPNTSIDAAGERRNTLEEASMENYPTHYRRYW